MKRDTADAKFSTMIRERDGWTCQRCFKTYPPPTRALHSAHCFSRGKARTRLDPANAAYEPQIYDPHQVRIQGKLAGLLRRYN